MTYEEFYGSALPQMKQTEQELLDKISAYTETFEESGVKPLVYFCSRLKSPESVLRKCRVQEIEPSVESAFENLFDLIGIRVVCAFASDVYRMAEWLRKQPDIKIIREKDYYAYPKPNGYRSYHIQLNHLTSGMPAEIQIRTIATDFWATLEHQLKYKKKIPAERMIRDELKRCADEIASVDISMQTIREIIQESLGCSEEIPIHSRIQVNG